MKGKLRKRVDWNEEIMIKGRFRKGVYWIVGFLIVGLVINLHMVKHYSAKEYVQIYVQIFLTLMLVALLLSLPYLFHKGRAFFRRKKGLTPITVSTESCHLNRAFLASLGHVVSIALLLILIFISKEPWLQTKDLLYLFLHTFAFTLYCTIPLFWAYGAFGIFQIVRYQPQLRLRPRAIVSYLLEAFLPLCFLCGLIRI